MDNHLKLDNDLNRPAVVAEVRAAFERYENALVAWDLDRMGDSFLDSEDVVRFGIADEQRGFAEIERWRVSEAPLPKGRTHFDTTVTTYGESVAIVATHFFYPDRTAVGRQSQTWLKVAQGWRIVHAHVSEVAKESTSTPPGHTASQSTGRARV